MVVYVVQRHAGISWSGLAVRIMATEMKLEQAKGWQLSENSNFYLTPEKTFQEYKSWSVAHQYCGCLYHWYTLIWTSHGVISRGVTIGHTEALYQAVLEELLTTHERDEEQPQDRWSSNTTSPRLLMLHAHTHSHTLTGKQYSPCLMPASHQMAHLFSPSAQRDARLVVPTDRRPNSPHNSWQAGAVTAPLVGDQMLIATTLVALQQHFLQEKTCSIIDNLWGKSRRGRQDLLTTTHIQKYLTHTVAHFTVRYGQHHQLDHSATGESLSFVCWMTENVN